MTKAQPDGVIRTTVEVTSQFGERTIPAGTEGLVLEANPSGTYLVDLTLRPATDTSDGDFDQATLTDDQFDVITSPDQALKAAANAVLVFVGCRIPISGTWPV